MVEWKRGLPRVDGSAQQFCTELEELDQSVGLERGNRESHQFSLCMPNLIWGVDECVEKESGAAFKNECCDQLAMPGVVAGEGTGGISAT